MRKPADLVTVARFNQYFEAELSKAKLEAEGVECFLPDKHSGFLTEATPSSMTGFRLQVQKKDVSKAKKILKTLDFRID